MIQFATTCPSCGVPVDGSSGGCTLCRAYLRATYRRRVGLWGLVALEYLIALAVWAHHSS